MKLTNNQLFKRSTSVILLAILQLMIRWPTADCRVPNKCPNGWSCGFKDNWWAKSEFPETLNVRVTEIFSPNDTPFVHIDCQSSKGNEIRFPSGFLKNFTWRQTIEVYEFYSCPIPKNRTFVDILQGHQVEELRLKKYTLSEDALSPDIFEGLTKLTSLHIKEGNLTSLPTDFFFPLPNLVKLSLNSNNLSDLPPNIFTGLKNIQLLLLNNNRFTQFTKTMDGLSSLVELYLDNNEIKNISREFFASMPMLKVLDLQMNNLTNISSDTFHNIPQLTSLKLLRNQLEKLPFNLFQYQHHLQELDISYNPNLSRLPSQLIHNLTELRKLNITGVGLEIIPDSFFPTWGFNPIQVLNLRENKLTQLEKFDNFGNLTDLDLSFNQIKELRNNTFSSLTKLSSLKIRNNLLDTIESLAFTGLKQLTSLDLGSNNLETLPSEVFTYNRQLEELILDDNNFTFQYRSANPFRLPSFLRRITLSKNKIAKLPTHWFFEYPSLELIDLSHNKFEVFDFDDFQPSGQNTLLDLTYNQISSATLAISIANRLSEEKSAAFMTKSNNKVALGHNPFTCDCHAKDFLKYYKSQAEHLYQFDLDLFSLKCKRPPSLEDTPVIQLKSRQLICNIETDCHQLCKCDRHAFKQRVEVDCRNQTFKEPPDRVPADTGVLYLSGNRLESLVGFEKPQWANLSKLYLSNNLITELKIRHLPKMLQLLDLQGNRLSSLSNETLKMFDDHPEMEIYLQGNPWSCSCSAKDFQAWLNANVQRLGNVSNIRCNDTNNPIYSENFCLPVFNTKGVLVGATILSLLLAVGLATAGIGYYRYRQPLKIWLYAHRWCMWFVTENEIDRDKKYDAFISFSQEDSEFVACHLLPGLEQGEPPYKVCIHYRDWLAGEWIPDQIIHSVQDSRRTIVVLTKNFIRSVWGRLEFKAAHHQALQDQTNRIIIIVYGDLPPSSEMDPELKTYVKFNTYLKWGEPWFWQKLRYAMPHSSLLMPSKRSATITALSSSMSDQSRITSLDCISSSLSNGVSGSKVDLVCT